MDVKAFEDGRWGGFSQKKEFRHTAAVSLITGKRVLDIGCGDGLLLSLLQDKDAEGVDISEAAVAKARQRGVRAQTIASAESLPYEDGSFDTVVMLDILEHVYDPRLLLNEAKRVSRGKIIVGVPNFSSLPARLQVLFGRVPENNAPHKAHIYWFNRPVLSRVLKEAGLKEVGTRMNSFGPFKAAPALVTTAPNLLALSFVVAVELAPESIV